MAALAGDPGKTTEVDVVKKALRAEYDVKGELGRGGMAIVYRAHEIMLDREVALKVLPFSLAFDSDFVERFQREARTAARLEHPNIIPIYRVGKTDNVIYFAMRYLRGQSLAQVIEREGAMDPAVIRQLLIECAAALGYADKHGIVHRDIKPDNIMFKETGEAVLCDFGIAKAASGTKLTGTGMAIGTPYYMSPEQARAQPLDGRSDLYSLGVVAYQCLAGHVPFQAEDSFSVGYKHIMEDLPTPKLKTPDQWALFEVVKKMMAKEPSNRFQNAAELVALLSADAETAAILPTISAAPTTPIAAVPAVKIPTTQPARPSTPTTPMPQSNLGARVSARRPEKKSRAGVLVGALVFLIVGGVGGGWYYVNNMGGSLPGLSNRAQVDVGEAPPLVGLGPVVDTTTTQVTAVDSIVEESATEVQEQELALVSEATDSTEQTPDESDTLAVDVPSEPISGELVLSNLGRSARLSINGESVRGLRHSMPPGEYTVLVQRPGFEDHTAQVRVTAGQSRRHRVNWIRRVTRQPRDLIPPPAEGQCTDPSRNTYNANNVCFDARPRPRVATLVPIPGGIPTSETPSAVVLVLRVSASGMVEQVRFAQRSSHDGFTVAAVEFAKQVEFIPAQKGGLPVAAWIQQPFVPRPRD